MLIVIQSIGISNISNNISKKQKKLTGEVEVDEMYYGKKKGSIGRNNKGKIILFCLKQRDGKVLIKRIENCKSETLISQIEQNIAINRTIYMLIVLNLILK